MERVGVRLEIGLVVVAFTASGFAGLVSAVAALLCFAHASEVAGSARYGACSGDGRQSNDGVRMFRGILFEGFRKGGDGV